MGGSLYKWYQDEALMEGKKISTSIIHLAIDLGEIEGRRSKKQWKLKRTLGWAGIPSFSRSCKKREKKKTPPYIAKGNGSHNLKVQNGLEHRSTGFGRI